MMFAELHIKGRCPQNCRYGGSYRYRNEVCDVVGYKVCYVARIKLKSYWIKVCKVIELNFELCENIGIMFAKL